MFARLKERLAYFALLLWPCVLVLMHLGCSRRVTSTYLNGLIFFYTLNHGGCMSMATRMASRESQTKQCLLSAVIYFFEGTMLLFPGHRGSVVNLKCALCPRAALTFKGHLILGNPFG